MHKILEDKHNKIRLLVLCLLPPAVVAGALVLRHFSFACPIERLFGILCPGCGMTRALKSLLQGQFGRSVLYNPCALLLSVGCLLYYTEQWFALFGKRLHLLPRNKWCYLILGMLLVLYWILRNIPAFAFLSIA